MQMVVELWVVGDTGPAAATAAAARRYADNGWHIIGSVFVRRQHGRCGRRACGQQANTVRWVRMVLVNGRRCGGAGGRVTVRAAVR